MRLANQRNGVSQRHGEITRGMWHDLWPELPPDSAPITSVTNGVHLPTWISPKVSRLLDDEIGEDWREESQEQAVWDRVRGIDDRLFWNTHLAAKRELMDFLRERTHHRWLGGDFDAGQILTAGPFLDDAMLTLGFARRFATYKRATLLFHDPDRLASILNNPDCPVQIIFAGKAHPADEGGKKLIQEICWRARDPKFGGRIAFAEDYDMGLAAKLVAGVDVWLNNPRAPLEASGTSGMKAAANGIPNLSILDGWWREAWKPDNSNGWGLEPSTLEGWQQDAADAYAIYDTLEQLVTPLYYKRGHDHLPHDWIAVAKEAMRTVAPAFSARRMVLDYIDRLYRPAATGLALTAR
jgi:starch phosphorylase